LRLMLLNFFLILLRIDLPMLMHSSLATQRVRLADSPPEGD